jgi:hypothetical protein
VQIQLLEHETIESLVFEAAPQRTPGLHVSQIIKSICIDIDPKRFTQENERLPWERFESGFTFERVLEVALQSRRADIFRPGEVEKDGIILSPDGIDAAGDEFSFAATWVPGYVDWVLEEYKFTWMSSREAPDAAKFIHWFWQMKAYCYALETLRARLRVLFVNGDYQGSGPQYKVWDIQFTERELIENWNMLLGQARAKGWL